MSELHHESALLAAGAVPRNGPCAMGITASHRRLHRVIKQRRQKGQLDLSESLAQAKPVGIASKCGRSRSRGGGGLFTNMDDIVRGYNTAMAQKERRLVSRHTRRNASQSRWGCVLSAKEVPMSSCAKSVFRRVSALSVLLAFATSAVCRKL